MEVLRHFGLSKKKLFRIRFPIRLLIQFLSFPWRHIPSHQNHSNLCFYSSKSLSHFSRIQVIHLQEPARVRLLDSLLFFLILFSQPLTFIFAPPPPRLLCFVVLLNLPFARHTILLPTHIFHVHSTFHFQLPTTEDNISKPEAIETTFRKIFLICYKKIYLLSYQFLP